MLCYDSDLGWIKNLEQLAVYVSVRIYITALPLVTGNHERHVDIDYTTVTLMSHTGERDEDENRQRGVRYLWIKTRLGGVCFERPRRRKQEIKTINTSCLDRNSTII